MDPNRKRLVIGAVVLFAIAFALGWAARSVKPKVEIRERVVTKEVAVDKYIDRVVEKRVVDTQVKYRTIRTAVTEPGGKTTVTEETAVDSDQSKQRNTDTVAAKETKREASASTDIKMIQTPAALPQWRISPMMGVDGGDLSSVFFGGMVERRILGPIQLGAWGLSNGNIGISVGIDL